VSTKKAQRNPRPSSYDALTEAELQRILAAAKNNPATEDLHDLVTIVSRTGIRNGEVVRLRWSDIDLDKGQLVVDAKASGTRTVPFEAESLKAFEALRARRPGSELLLGNSPRGVFDRVSRQLRTLSAQVGTRFITFPAIRHTFCKRLLDGGVPAHVLMALCGWKSTYGPLTRFLSVSESATKREYDAAVKPEIQ
jgi:integrase